MANFCLSFYKFWYCAISEFQFQPIVQLSASIQIKRQAFTHMRFHTLWFLVFVSLFCFILILLKLTEISVRIFLWQAGQECTLVSEIAKARQHIKSSLERVSQANPTTYHTHVKLRL